MDVSKPNNWPRIEFLIESAQFDRTLLSGLSVDEQVTADALQQLHQLGYVSEPHAAVAYQGIVEGLLGDEVGVFLGTAHPAKFKATVEAILGIELPLPEAIAACVDKPDLSTNIEADFSALKHFLTTS